MTVFRLWLALTRMVLTGRGRYPIGAVINNSYDDRDRHVTAVQSAANWQVNDLFWEDGNDRFAVLSCEPDVEPVYEMIDYDD
jgi:hypothetical protein